MINWEPYIVALIGASPAILLSALTFFKARETHILVNSRMDELLRISKQSAAADATLVEKQAEHARQGEAALATVAAEDKKTGDE